MEGHRLRVGALAWSSSLLSSGGRDKNIYQRDIRTQEDFVSKLSGHKSEVRFVSTCQLHHSTCYPS
jgi:cell division cycle 20-like protein 1 (cofactor of APC complex)